MKAIKIFERLIAAFFIMIGVAVTVFIFMRFTPGDPVDLMMGEAGNVSQQEVAALREQFNLDKPIYAQLYEYMGSVVIGDLGVSFKKKRPVSDLIRETLPATVELALAAVVFALVIALPIGVYSAVRQNSLVDRVSMGLSFLGVSMPTFWLGIVLIIIFSIQFDLVPVKGRLDYGLGLTKVTGIYVWDSLLTGNFTALKSALSHLILPAVTLGATMAAIVARVMRSSMLEVLRQDYVMLARAKGLSEFSVIVRHAMRNAMIPVLTVVGIEVGVLLGGNMIVETVFGWPGLGRLAVDAIFNRDYPLVQGVVMFYAFVFVMANLVVDVLYTLVNPKISM